MPLTFTADVKSPAALSDANLPVLPYEYGRAFLAEGDSWFSLGKMPSYNLLFGLRFARSALIVNCAKPGDTIRNMVDWRGNDTFAALLGPGGDFRWSGILVSGGGNDLFNALPHLIRSFPSAPEAAAIDARQVARLIDADGFTLFETYLRQNYADLIAQRDAQGSRNQGVPVFAHTYDYATPRDAKADFFGFPAFGPWLYTTMLAKNIPPILWIPLAQLLQDKTADILLTLNLPNLHVIDTRGVLIAARLGSTGPDGDWDNETHPTRAGYQKLAAKWHARIAGVLPDGA